MTTRITAALVDLLAARWVRDSTVSTIETYPPSGLIVLTDGDGHWLSHSYTVHADSSDYPGDDHEVVWTPVTVYEVKKRYTQVSQHIPTAAIEAEKAARIHRDVRLKKVHDQAAAAVRERERAEYLRLKAIFEKDG